MKISIVTVVLNNKSYIEECINSVLTQNYMNIEHVIIDGGSTDGTVEIIKETIEKFPERYVKFISEKDAGIYDAMNKGIRLATGDIVGILNSDDIYSHPSVLQKVTIAMDDPSVDACFADLVYVDRKDISKIVRYWQSCRYKENLFKKGWVLPHPTLFVRKKLYEIYGLFDLSYKLAADYEFIVRLLSKHKIKTTYIPEVIVKMRTGGETNKSLINILKQNIEILNALKKNEVSVSVLPFFILKLKSRYQQYSYSTELK